ncbi:MAG: SBBP repeat-containing protein [Flavipsychrobacter sp.]|nr:SBBP repeat-containing protein [Flavipsychrobacter sp.]
MKLLIKVLAIGLLPSVCSAAPGAAKVPSSVPEQTRSLYFMENKGQIVDQNYQPRTDIDFNLAGKGFAVFVGQGQMHYQFDKLENAEAINAQKNKQPVPDEEPVKEIHSYYRVDVELVGANKKALAVAENRQPDYDMYYLESAPNGVKVNGYARVVYKDVYPNIDWVLYSKKGDFKYEFIVHEGGNPADIKVRFNGATKLDVSKEGNFTITTPFGTITDQAPLSFDATGRKVSSDFVLNGNELTYKLGKYSGELTIDPTVTWGTYYGGNSSSNDYVYSVAVTPNGNEIYIGGYTSSTTNIATTGSYQASYSQTSYTDGMLVKFNASGVRQWGTYYGGNSTTYEYCYSIALDPSGNVFLSGRTNNSTAGVISSGSVQQISFSGTYDCFLVKFNNAGTRQWGTYLGGTGDDYAYGLACDNNGDIYICGYTYSPTNFTTPFAYQPTFSVGPDAFLVKYNTSGTRLWGTYYGGDNTDLGTSCTVDASGNPYLTGYTYSVINISSTGAHKSSYSVGTDNQDGFLARFNGSTGARLWGTYFGGTGGDVGYGIAASKTDSCHVYLFGSTTSTSSIALGSVYQSTYSGGADAFLTKFDSSGTQVWGTYYGGSNAEYLYYGGPMLATDLNGNIFVGGVTLSGNNIATNGIYNTHYSVNSYDAFFGKFTSGGQLSWGSYYCGNSTDYLYGIATDLFGNMYACGMTFSTVQVATTGTHQPSMSTSPDGYLVKVQDCAIPAMPGTITGATTVCQGTSQTYSIAAVTGATSYIWSLPNGWTGTSTTNSITVTPSATSGQVRVRAAVACGASPWSTLSVTALPAPGATITPSGPTTFCAGANVTLTANTGTGYTYIWKQGTTVLGTTTNAHVANATGNYTVEVTNPGNGCISTSAVTGVTVNPNPVINFPSLSATCTNNAIVNLMATPSGGTYTGAGVSGTQLNPLNAGPGIHSVIYSYTDNNGCTSTGSQSITVNPAPVINFPALSDICADNPLTLNMATPPGGTYTGTGVSNGVFNPLVSGTGNFNITYTYTDMNNCTASDMKVQHVDPLTAVNFPSISAKCIDAPIVNLMATPAGGTFSGTGVTGTQFNPAIGAGSHVIHYDYTNGFGCTTHDSETIVVNALPVMNFPALGSVCDNAPVTMAATPAGGMYTGPGTSGTTTTLNTTSAGPGMHAITYTYTDANTCTNSTTTTVDIHPQPVITSQPYLYIEICAGEALATNVGAVSVGSYQWTQNGVNIAGANSNTYVVPVTNTTHSGNYNVIITGTGACSTTQILSSPTAVLVNANPAVNLTPGSDTICVGDTLVLNSGLTSGMSYQWKENGINISGATSPTYGVATAGVYKVTVTSLTTGCVTTSPEATIGVNPSPSENITHSGITEFCDGGVLAITATDTTTGTTFQWQNGGVDISGANNTTYNANTTGLYTVVVTNTYNCSRTSAEVAVIVNPLPTPTVTVLDAFGKMTVNQTYNAYQWNLNGNPIGGATSQEYQGTQSGNYSVTVTDSNGCQATSQVLNPTAVSSVAGNSNFVLYPNPNSGSFFIDGTFASNDGKVSFEIVDATGKLVYKEELKISGDKLHHQLDINQVAAGAYLIRIVSDSGREAIPFVKR